MPGASSGPQGLYTAYIQPIYSLYAAKIQPKHAVVRVFINVAVVRVFINVVVCVLCHTCDLHLCPTHSILNAEQGRKARLRTATAAPREPRQLTSNVRVRERVRMAADQAAEARRRS